MVYIFHMVTLFPIEIFYMHSLATKSGDYQTLSKSRQVKLHVVLAFIFRLAPPWLFSI